MLYKTQELYHLILTPTGDVTPDGFIYLCWPNVPQDPVTIPMHDYWFTDIKWICYQGSVKFFIVRGANCPVSGAIKIQYQMNTNSIQLTMEISCSLLVGRKKRNRSTCLSVVWFQFLTGLWGNMRTNYHLSKVSCCAKNWYAKRALLFASLNLSRIILIICFPINVQYRVWKSCIFKSLQDKLLKICHYNAEFFTLGWIFSPKRNGKFSYYNDNGKIIHSVHKPKFTKKPHPL